LLLGKVWIHLWIQLEKKDKSYSLWNIEFSSLIQKILGRIGVLEMLTYINSTVI
jgi:hypothetical protein